MKHVLALVAVVGVGCGGSDSPSEVSLATQEAQQDFLWSYCLPLADIMTGLAPSKNGLVAGPPFDCPQGGTATYDDETGEVALNNCQAVDSTVNGTVTVSLLEERQAQITNGDINVTGAFAGMLDINSGTMSWELPVADATTFWQLYVNIDGEEVCLWSGAESGPCQDLF